MAVEDIQTLVTGLVASHGEQLRRFLLDTDVVTVGRHHGMARIVACPNIESIRSPEAYLFTVAQHVAQQHTLRQSTMPPGVELTQLLNSPQLTSNVDPALEIDAQQCLEKLQDALDRLSPKMRATFILHRRDGLSFDEIGNRLGISRPMVKKYLMKALMHFRQRLEQAE